MRSPLRRRLAHATSAALLLSFVASSPALAAAGLVRSPDDTYWIGADGKRYLFPGQDEAMKSWSFDATAVRNVTLEETADHPFAGTVRFRPGHKPARVLTSPGLYAVARHGVLRPIPNAAVAQRLYPTLKDADVPAIAIAQFTNYVIGDPVDEAQDFDPAKEAAGITTPDDNPALVIQYAAHVTQKKMEGKVEVTVTKDADGAPIARARIEGANSPPQSLTIELVNQSNIPIQTCTSSDHCQQALIGDFATNVEAVVAKVTNELGQVIQSEPVRL